MEKPSSTRVLMAESGTFLLSSLRILARGLPIPDVGTSFSASEQNPRHLFAVSHDQVLGRRVAAAPLLNVDVAALRRNPRLAAISFAGESALL